MLALMLFILAIIIGLGLTFFANQNSETVGITIGSLRWENVPLYLVVTLSLLLGLLIAWVFSLINAITSSISLFGKDVKINKANKINQDLNQKIEYLRTENDRLRQKVRFTS
jgi:uncharacterized protein HemY